MSGLHHHYGINSINSHMLAAGGLNSNEANCDAAAPKGSQFTNKRGGNQEELIRGLSFDALMVLILRERERERHCISTRSILKGKQEKHEEPHCRNCNSSSCQTFPLPNLSMAFIN